MKTIVGQSVHREMNARKANLRLIHAHYKEFIKTESRIMLANVMKFRHNKQFDLVITSPPYMNGLDYRRKE